MILLDGTKSRTIEPTQTSNLIYGTVPAGLGTEMQNGTITVNATSYQ
jgi:hypothetical protein